MAEPRFSPDRSVLVNEESEACAVHELSKLLLPRG